MYIWSESQRLWTSEPQTATGNGGIRLRILINPSPARQQLGQVPVLSTHRLQYTCRVARARVSAAVRSGPEVLYCNLHHA